MLASASTGAVTLSLPQSIHTGATPTFSTLTITSAASNAISVTGSVSAAGFAASGTATNQIQCASGVYSNGDLAANYAGMKFYQNLRHPVRIGDTVHPPMFDRTPEGWRLRPDLKPDRLLKPFLSNHLDESLNPSRYRFSRKSIRSTIRNRCELWSRFYADRLDLIAPAGKSFAVKWFGEDYGYWLPPKQEVSIGTECGAVVTRSGKTSIAGTF